MVKIYAIENNEQFFQLDQKGLRIVNYDQDLTVGSKGYMPSRLTRYRLASQSKFPDASAAWAEMSEEDKLTWWSVAKITDETSWHAYLRNVRWDPRHEAVELGDGDFGVLEFGAGYAAMPVTAAIMANYDLPGNFGRVKYGRVKYGGVSTEKATEPEILWSGNSSRFLFDATGRTVEWFQLHPENYTIRKLVDNGGKVYRNYNITEVVTLPMTVAFSYCNYIEVIGDYPSTELVIQLDYDDSGTLRTQEIPIPLILSPNWTRVAVDIATAPGQIYGYRLVLRCTDIINMTLLDRISVTHSGANWAIDPECEDMQFDLAEIYKDVLKPWRSDDDGAYTFAFSAPSDDVPLVVE